MDTPIITGCDGNASLPPPVRPMSIERITSSTRLVCSMASTFSISGDRDCSAVEADPSSSNFRFAPFFFPLFFSLCRWILVVLDLCSASSSSSSSSPSSLVPSHTTLPIPRCSVKGSPGMLSIPDIKEDVVVVVSDIIEEPSLPAVGPCTLLKKDNTCLARGTSGSVPMGRSEAEDDVVVDEVMGGGGEGRGAKPNVKGNKVGADPEEAVVALEIGKAPMATWRFSGCGEEEERSC